MQRVLLFLVICMAVLASCSHANHDEELAAAAQRKLVASAVLNPSVTVKNGVATLSGECANQPCSVDAAARLDSIEGINSVINKIVIKTPTGDQ